jgi:site-specific DNA recombinase
VETRFVRAPQSTTAEDQPLVQFQGMIAEYERAQILKRSRRGKTLPALADDPYAVRPANWAVRPRLWEFANP